MSTPNPTTKKMRLLARVRDIEDRLDRLRADMDEDLEGFVVNAWQNVRTVKNRLEAE